MPEISDQDYDFFERLKSDYQARLRENLENPKDRSMRFQLSVRRPVNQDSWTVLITRAWFDEETKDWRQEYVKDLVWESYQGFDVLDISNVTFSGPRLYVDLPDLNKVLAPPKTGAMRYGGNVSA